MKKMLQDLLELDQRVYLKIHKLSKIKIIRWLMKYLTHLGSNPFGFIYGAIILGLAYFKDYKQVDHLLVSIIVSQIIVHTLKRLISRRRPYKKMVVPTVKRPPNCVYSFPSGHTAIAVTTGLGWSLLFPAWTPVFLILAGLIGLSRIILGYHYPLDVLFGGTIAYGIHLLALFY